MDQVMKTLDQRKSSPERVAASRRSAHIARTRRAEQAIRRDEMELIARKKKLASELKKLGLQPSA
jgi:hypothetical protein